jgi:hypothetical protein
MEEKIKSTPFVIADSDQFKEARIAYKAEPRQDGWALTMTESLGLLKRPAPDVGGCLGCYFNQGALAWILNAVFAAVENNRVDFFPSGRVFVLLEEPAKLSDKGQSDVLYTIDQFRRRPKLETMFVRGTLPNHATMVYFRRTGTIITATWADPHGPVESGITAARVIKEFLDENGPADFTYAAERTSCLQGPQSLEEYVPRGVTKEPGGYCTAWTALTMILSAGTDGAHPNEVHEELRNAFGTNPAYTTSFIRMVTRNMAALVREKLNPTAADCENLPCCGAESYCSLPQSITIGDKRYLFNSGCFQPTAYLFTSRNGMHWLKVDDKKMVGVRIVQPSESWSAKQKEFRKYCDLQEDAFTLGIGPNMGTPKTCLIGAWADTSAYPILFVFLDSELIPLKSYGQPVAPFSAAPFARFSRQNQLTFRYLFDPSSVYIDPVSKSALLLDLDIARWEDPVPADIQEQYEKLIAKITAPHPSSSEQCLVC